MNYWFLRRSDSLSKKIITAFLLLSFCTTSQFALANIERSGTKVSQQKKATISGVVVDTQGVPLIGVNVEEEGTYNGVSTDVDGNFTITLTDIASQLMISYIGYDTQIVQPTLSAMKVVLEESTTMLEDVVVVGYGAQKKESVVGSIAQVEGDGLKSKGAVSNITDALSGSIPGVTVMTTSSIPGGTSEHGDSSTILIRGMSTWNNAQPLILVDGVERGMDDIDINEIENFSVLKDASATAVFGVKGANGVILITTKRGEVGKAKVTFESNLSFKSISSIEQPVESYDGLLARNYAVVNELPRLGETIWSNYTSNSVLELYRTEADPEKYTNVDWRDVMLRDVAITQKYNVNVSGGTDFVKYFTSVGYLNEGDILASNEGTSYDPEFKYERFNFRTNLDFQLTKTTTFKVNLSGYYGKQQQPGCGIHSLYYSLYKYDPSGYLPVYSDGTYGMDYSDSDRIGFNGYYSLYSGGVNVYNRTSITSDFELNQKLDFITKGLSIKGKFAYDNYMTSLGQNITDSTDNYIRKGFDVDSGEWIYDIPAAGTDGFDFYPDELGTTAEYTNATQAENTTRDIYYEIGLSYARQFGDHNVSGLALFSREHNTTGSSWPEKREDWVGRVTYDYRGKYLFETNGAYNGSEKFGPDYRFGFFPSLALGWRISEEKFMQKNLPFISNLKVKYSIGLIGNDDLNDIGQWPYVTTWNESDISGPYFGSGTSTATSYPITEEGTPGNPDLHWEVAKKQNIGIEVGLFNGLISGNIDIFNEHRTDMLVAADDRNVPDFFGQTASAANVGEVKSNGVEIDIHAQKTFGKVHVWGSYNWTVAKNEIIYKEDPELAPFYQQEAGYSINQTITTPVTGIIQSWDDMYTLVKNETSTSNDILTPGCYVLLDYNGDGVIDSNDATAYGYSQYPQNTYGFSFGADYKGFSVSVQFYGAYNTTISCAEFYDEFSYDSAMVYSSLLESTWTPEYGNSDATYRALSSYGQHSATGSASYCDGSYLRLKSAEISYTLPKSFVKTLSLENIRVYVNGNNLCFWSDLPVDVEGSNFTLKSYPVTKQFNLGVNVTF